MTEQLGPVVRITHRFAESAERVFNAWLDPATAGKFLFATPTGEMVRVQIESRRGGRYEIIERRDGGEVAHLGEYLEIERPTRLVFTLSVPRYSAHVDRVTIAISSLPDGCLLTFTDQMAPGTEEHLERATNGWATILANLEKILG
ncbi:MAG: SRPBCC family protein [Vicinamibacterales bacterium]